MLDTSRSLDYAYGLNGCTRLARGGFNRNTNCHGKGYPKTKTIFCPDKNDKNVEGECPPENADTNADTFSFIAAGVFFSVECKKEIPLPTERLDPAKRDNLATPTTLLRVRAPQATNGLEESQTCEAYDDAIFWDDPEPEESDGDTGGGRLEGYVHFGDSYAAGMGTGVTSGDSCRVGQNNYGDLLYKQFGDNKIPYQKKVCSGDTLTGLNRQVSEWKDPGKANVGTLSIGGNDIGFSDLVWYCIITPYTARTGESNKELCQAALIRAYGLMAEDLGDRLAAAYKSILDKSGRKDFHLYVTGYVPFFNVDTADCDKSSFHYWWGGYNPASDGRIVLLNKDLRLKMNNLVVDLNTLIDISVAGANKQHGSENVHFVDVGNRYDKHRFCEDEKVHEPAPQRSDTWFFLSGWPDVGVSGNAADQAVEQQEIGAMVEQGRVPLPNSDCDIMDINDIDPYERALCRIRETIDEDPEGPEAKYLEEANKHIKEGNVSSQAIGWFTPTRQIKTFHPRSAGMEAYAQAVRQAIAASQKF
ncbi:SGNH hydrolase [Sporormia fimetaria CBS 119925]|uniref:SGNH hydrolase n=1 Tax=Sporormia fimetaria CBS 119925 TaxID=1340428 RepID=A0A6A6V8Z9_9PLEO|nr:SGNH hydrolase [Sporormia fimetaria CBS 119925]